MDLWQQVQQVFDAALQHPPEERQEFLEQECGSNLELRREVESLLAAHGESGSFMGEPAIAGMAEELQRTTNRFQAGDTLGAYKVLDLVGRGGMGEVYRARDNRLKRDVAIKVLPREFAADRERLRRFEQEARSAAALNHPNIVSVHDMGTADGSPYIVSELLEGQNLREVLRQGPVPARKALDYAIQAARGLAAAHDIGIVHRDLKPENLFITKDGRLKILDFGLAKLTRLEGVGADSSRTESVTGTEVGQVFGTVGYMSPEQVRGQNADHRSDIFSFGAILYELFSGKRAFSGDSTADTMSAILHEDPPELTRATPPVHPAVDHTIRHCLEKNPLERFQSAHDLAFQLEVAAEGSGKTPVTSAGTKAARSRKTWLAASMVAVLVALSAAAGLYYRAHRQSRRLTDKDTIILADFANSTGDAVFDDTLRTALDISLRQSPFLNVLSSSEVTQILQQMARPVGTRLTPEVARELCLRAGDKAYIAGTISSLGSAYVLGLKALNCQSGDPLAQEQVTAASKEKVLDALGDAASKLRGELGESLATVEKFDVPLLQATTSSLEALKAYSLGDKASREQGDPAASLPHDRRSIELDANFAMGYRAVGIDYANLGETERSKEYFTKAFQLREHTSDRERLTITADYYETVTGELDKAAETWRDRIANYPRDAIAYNNLGIIYSSLGQHEKAMEITRQAVRLAPDRPLLYINLAADAIRLQHFDESRQFIREAQARKSDGPELHISLYYLGFLNSDIAAMEEQLRWFAGKPAYENRGLALESSTEAYGGHLAKSRELTRRAVDAAIRADQKEIGADYLASNAVDDAARGDATRARQTAAEASKLAPAAVDVNVALALAMAGETSRAESLAKDLGNRYPLDTLIQSLSLPMIHAQLALNRKNPALALDLLKAAYPLELTDGGLYCVYIRATAYLAAGEGSAAATEFQKILDHSGIVTYSVTGVLAHLGVGRANALQSRTLQGADAEAARSRAVTAYKKFFALWKDADSDIPVLKEAKAEYANLK